MRKFYRLKAGAVLIFLIGQTLLFPLLVARASSVPSPALAVDVSKITSLGAMRTWMDSLYAECLQAKQDSRFTFELQERILKKSGDSISRILKLEQQGKSPAQKAFRAAFEKNEAIFQFIIQSNEEVVEEIQEEKLDKVEDTQAFLDSTEWQMPHRMISLSRYWMSWSRYYRSLLYPEGDPEASSLLSEAIGGFSLTLFDLEDPTIVAKSLFGRALCFKEMKKYKKAVEDLASITQNVRHNDPLYIWSLYEQALIAYRLRNYETALANLDTLETGIEEQTVSHVLGNEHKRLRERVVLEPRVTALLAKLNKEADTTGEAAKQLCHELHGALKRLSLYDAAHATRLYRLVVEHPAFFSSFSYEDLGPVGNLAMADSRFKQGQYEDALKRYRSLWTSPDVTIRKRLDELYFRSGYAECQLGRWKEALACFERLQREYPHSKLAGKAVCLEYVAAAGRYKRNPGEANYSRYIASARRYLKECPNPRDRDGAHFVLGEDYRKKGKPGKARKEFAFITKGSPHYWPARYYMVKTDVEALEKRTKKGGKKSAGTKKLYQNLAAQLALFQKLAQRKHPEPGIADVAPQMTILQARLSACCTPEESCSQVTRILKDFEKRFPGNRPLWLEAMRLRLACYEQHRMIDASKGQILYLSKKYPLDEDLWDFLGEWAERYDKKAKALRPPHDPALGDGYRKLSLMIYTKMAELAAGEARYGKYLDTIRIRMGEILLALGRTQRAARIYEALLKRAPDSAEALYHLGTIYQGQGRWNAALRVWRKYSKGMDAGCDAWLDARYRIALAHSEMGGPAEACEVITMIRVLHPHMEDAELKQKLLDLEKKVCAPGATDQASGSRR